MSRKGIKQDDRTTQYVKDKTKHDITRRDNNRQGVANQDETKQATSRKVKNRQDKTRQYNITINTTPSAIFNI